jgi:hypothetical protein
LRPATRLSHTRGDEACAPTRVRQYLIESAHSSLQLRERQIVGNWVARRGARMRLIAGRRVGEVNHTVPNFKV